MSLIFEKITKEDSEKLVEWLSSEPWPFFMGKSLTKDEVLKRLSEGAFFGEGEENFWVKNAGRNEIALIELYQLDDLAPQFSVRLKEQYRGLGYGKLILDWLTKYIFETFPDKRRIEAQTREDNVAMRKLFNKCGYVKEAYYRMANPTDDGGRVACVGYGILREDWESGQLTPVKWQGDQFFKGDLTP